MAYEQGYCRGGDHLQIQDWGHLIMLLKGFFSGEPGIVLSGWFCVHWLLSFKVLSAVSAYYKKYSMMVWFFDCQCQLVSRDLNSGFSAYIAEACRLFPSYRRIVCSRYASEACQSIYIIKSISLEITYYVWGFGLSRDFGIYWMG